MQRRGESLAARYSGRCAHVPADRHSRVARAGHRSRGADQDIARIEPDYESVGTKPAVRYGHEVARCRCIAGGRRRSSPARVRRAIRGPLRDANGSRALRALRLDRSAACGTAERRTRHQRVVLDGVLADLGGATLTRDSPGVQASGATGNARAKVVPCPGSDWTSTVPWWSWMMP